jgi:hypothetical protein
MPWIDNHTLCHQKPDETIHLGAVTAKYGPVSFDSFSNTRLDFLVKFPKILMRHCQCASEVQVDKSSKALVNILVR